MPRTLGTAISDEDDLILHRASNLLDALPWQRVRNLHTPRCEWMVGQPEAIGAPPGKKIPLKFGEKSPLTIVPQRPFHPLDRCTLLRVVSARGSRSPVADTRSPEKTLPHEAEAD